MYNLLNTFTLLFALSGVAVSYNGQSSTYHRNSYFSQAPSNPFTYRQTPSKVLQYDRASSYKMPLVSQPPSYNQPPTTTPVYISTSPPRFTSNKPSPTSYPPSTIHSPSAPRLMEGLAIPMDSFPDDHLLPSWVNLSLVESGRQFATQNIGFIIAGQLHAMLYASFLPTVKPIVLATGTAKSVEDSAGRLKSTVLHGMSWYQNSLQDFSERQVLLSSISKVRQSHFYASVYAHQTLANDTELESLQKRVLDVVYNSPEGKNRYFHDNAFWDAVYKDVAQSTIPDRLRQYPFHWKYNGVAINQFSLALIQFSLAGLPLIFRKELGMTRITEEESLAFIHMWAFFGHNLGIREEFNVCLDKDLDRSMALYRNILQMYFVPALFHRDAVNRVVLSAVFDAMEASFHWPSPKVVLYVFLRDIAQIDPVNLRANMDLGERASTGAILSFNFGGNGRFGKWLGNSFINFSHETIKQLGSKSLKKAPKRKYHSG